MTRLFTYLENLNTKGKLKFPKLQKFGIHIFNPGPERSDEEKLIKRKRSGLKVCVKPRQTKRPTSKLSMFDIFDAVNLDTNREAGDLQTI